MVAAPQQDGSFWSPGIVDSVLQSLLHDRRLPSDTPSVLMPPSYAALIGNRREPLVMFGSLQVSDNMSKAASSTQPVLPASDGTDDSAATAPVQAARPRPDRWVNDEDGPEWQRHDEPQERAPRSAARAARGEAWAPRMQ